MIQALALGAALTALAEEALAQRYTWSAHGAALAPNAGGQEAYSLKLARGWWEAGAFSNTYILANDLPLSGITFDWRFPVCGQQCFWQFYVQAGGGVSNGGPIAQFSWSAILPGLPIWLPREAPPYLPALRVDFVTQLIFIQYRAITWSYPLWLGISLHI